LVDIRPFKALLYTTKAGDPENLITQPYDKIDLQLQKEYYAKSPYNYCRLILPLEENKYQVANERIMQWLKEGIIAKETQPAIFVSRQEFILEGKKYAHWNNCCPKALQLQRKHGISPRRYLQSA
jgi:uncharacterized protein (DUF1015 family)